VSDYARLEIFVCRLFVFVFVFFTLIASFSKCS